MKKKFYMSSIICLLFSCILTTITLASSTDISINIYEISVKCNGKGTYYINDVAQTEDKSFFRRHGDSLVVKVEPKKGYKLDGILCNTDGIVVIGTDSVTINNLQSNVEIEFKIKRVAGGSIEVEGPGNSACDGGVNCPIKHFTDVNTKEWYHEDLDYVVLEGLMNGVDKNLFDPHGSTTRAMIVTILYRLEGSPKVSNKTVFDDVEENTWYTAAVTWANSKGIVLGYGDDTFGPTDDVTREQMVTILYRYAKYKKHSLEINNKLNIKEFGDLNKVSNWAYTAMEWACSKEIIRGSDGMLLPKNNTERCQIAAILHRFCEDKN